MYYVIQHVAKDLDNVAMLFFTNHGDNNWYAGKKLAVKPTEPIEVGADPDFKGEVLEFDTQPLPLMTEKMFTVIQKLGVTNLETFKAEVETSWDKKKYLRIAFNIIGAVQVSELKTLEPGAVSNDKLILTLIRKLDTLILVHESLKKAFEDAGIDTVTFLESKEVEEA